MTNMRKQVFPAYLSTCHLPDSFVCPQCGNWSARELIGLGRWEPSPERPKSGLGHHGYSSIRAGLDVGNAYVHMGKLAIRCLTCCGIANGCIDG